MVDLLIYPKGAQYFGPTASSFSFPLALIKQPVKKAVKTAKRDGYIGLLRVPSQVRLEPMLYISTIRVV